MIEMTPKQSRAVSKRLLEIDPSEAARLREDFGTGRQDPMMVFPDIRDRMIDLPPPPPAVIQTASPEFAMQQLSPIAPQTPQSPAPQYVEDADLAYYAWQGGFSGRDLITAIAIAIAESGEDPQGGNYPLARADAIGDESKAKGQWGPSIGMFQVRSLKDPNRPDLPSVDQLRKAEDLFKPERNAAIAYAIYEWRKKRGDDPFTDWSVYKDGSYKQHIDRARRAAAAIEGKSLSRYL